MADRDNFLCGLGWHAAPRFPRWNDGYYFATCRRCGSDIVRTAYDGWRVPQGHRIVWQHEAPERAPAPAMFDPDEIAALVAEPAREAAAAEEIAVASAPDEEAVPTNDVAEPEHEPEPDQADLPDDEPEAEVVEPLADADPVPAESEPEPVVEQRRSLVPDFMDDPWPMAQAATIARQPLKVDRIELIERDSSDWRASLDRLGLGSLGRLANRRPLGDAGNDADDDERRDTNRQAWLIAIALLLAGGAGFALATRDGGATSAPPAATTPPPAVAPANSTQPVLETGEAALPPDVAAAGTVAYVRASLLRCRAQPDGSAQTMARLRRNQRVRVLDVQGPWSGLSVRGGQQCWAATEHLTTTAPR